MKISEKDGSRNALTNIWPMLSSSSALFAVTGARINGSVSSIAMIAAAKVMNTICQLIIVSNRGIMRVFNIADEFQPVLLWSFQVSESHIEATPAVWKDMIYVGARDGYMYAVGQKDS